MIFVVLIVALGFAVGVDHPNSELGSKLRGHEPRSLEKAGH